MVKNGILAVKKLSVLHSAITCNHNGDFYCINCLHSLRTINKLKKHKNGCKSYDYCYIEMLKKYDKILKYIHEQKCIKFPFILYADLESLIIIILKSHQRVNLINMHLLAVHCLHIVHLMQQKISLIIIETKTV